MKRIELFILAMAISLNVSAQVGINIQTVNINSALEVFSTNKGTLLPRIALVAANNIAPLTAHVAGMLVYNTATSGVGSNLVTPGYYYNNGLQWIRFIDTIQPDNPWFNAANNLPADANTQNIYHNGKVGIFTNNPTHALHVNVTTPGTDPVKIEGIREATTGSENQLYVNAAGIVHMSTQPSYTLFYALLKADQSITLATSPEPLIYAAPITSSALYSYNATTGVFTFKQPGNYVVTMQASFANIAADQQLTVGIRPSPYTDYIARGTGFSPVTISGTVGHLLHYTTIVQVKTANYSVKFVAVTNSSFTVLATEDGTTGQGNVSNISVRKI